MKPIRVTVWNEGRHEQKDAPVKAIYPQGIHGCIAAALRLAGGFEVRTATLDDPEHGLTDAVLDATDVLFWWGHCAHGAVPDALAQKVQQRVLAGMGFIALHSAHYAKPFKLLMGTNCSLRWREAEEKERFFVIDHAHPIAAGLPDTFELPHEEMYGERFDVPTPDELVFISWFEGGDVFRSGCTWRRGHGRVLYFRPGHETHPTYHDRTIQMVLANAARWAAQPLRRATNDSPWCKESFEPIVGADAPATTADV
ncbi:MAG: ThuA domain-containing protein [Planctomycetes bacterium]|nr:ThuA domain-containing protein [Planctomycetota bacterium]